ncbi:MAG: hypothetical protein CFE21_05965 [Bacteroidetes bacterium B1(2017)]|nr:MAG: hypothetical protein CFE21_05965 [Bacteroidetes bacterium B1(2017)]
MEDKQFKIELLDIHWLENSLEEDDLCAHGQVKVRIGNEIIVDQREKKDHWNLRAMAIHLLRTLENNHTPDTLVGDHLIPCCGHHIDHLENSEEVHIQGCFTGINYWVRHTDQKIKLTTELKTEIEISKNEYESEVKNFVDQVEEFYKLSKPKQLPEDNYDRKGYELFWKEWNRRRMLLDLK